MQPQLHCKRDLPRPVGAWQWQPMPSGHYAGAKGQRASERTERPRDREVLRGHGSLRALLELLFCTREEEEEEGDPPLRGIWRAVLDYKQGNATRSCWLHASCSSVWGFLALHRAPQSPLSGMIPLLPTSTAELTLLLGPSPLLSHLFSQNSRNWIFSSCFKYGQKRA